MGRGRILVSGDDAATRIVVNQALARAGYSARGTSDAGTLWKWIREGDGDVLISDIIPPGDDAFDLVPRIKDIRPDLPVIVLTAQNSLLTAIKATERCAYEYFSKPFDIGKLITVVERALRKPAHAQPPFNASEPAGDSGLIGHSAAMQEIHRVMARLLCADLPVLITGESGTGKRLAAQALYDFGPRHKGPFIPIQFAALSSDLSEAGPSSHGEGALTGLSAELAARFQQADGGTLLLDEIGDMPMQAQAWLLGALQEGPCLSAEGRMPVKPDVRIIATTNKTLSDQIAAGLFREDLYYRLNVIPLHMPPLREHLDDLSDLVQHFQKAAGQSGLRAKTFTPDAIQRLKRHRWPGNVRELRNFVERISALYSDEIISADIIDHELQVEPGGRESMSGGDVNLRQSVEAYLSRYFEAFDGKLPPPGLYDRIIHDVEEPLMSAVLTATGGSQVKAARLLGLNRNTLRKKLREQKHE